MSDNEDGKYFIFLEKKICPVCSWETDDCGFSVRSENLPEFNGNYCIMKCYLTHITKTIPRLVKDNRGSN